MSTILIVDDMAVFREPIAMALRGRGYKTVMACNGVEALRICRATPPDVILLDLAMPVMDGIQFLRQMGEESFVHRPHVIVLTAISDRDHVVLAAKLGARDFLLKSQFSIQELESRINRSLTSAEPPPQAAAALTGASVATSANSPVPAGSMTAVASAAPAFTSMRVAASAPVATSAAVTPAVPAAATIASSSSPQTANNPSTSSEGLFDPNMPPSLTTLKPLLTRSQIRDYLDGCGQLKAMSPSVAQILSLCRNPNCAIDQVARAIKQDHALALTMLKIANSSVYCRGEPVESVQNAVGRVGLAQTKQMVMNISVIDSFSKEDPKGRLRAPLFWEHSIACGLICAEISLALEFSADDIDSAFTAGLLHDVGRMVYTDMLGETYVKVLDAAEQLQLPLEQVETRMLLVNHADAMDRVLHSWHFPKHLIDPIVFHHLSVGNIRRMSPRMVKQASILGLADRLAHAMLIGDSGNNTIYPTAEFVQALALPPRLMENIENTVPDQTSDIKFSMLSRLQSSGWEPVRDTVRKQLGHPIRPLVISAEPAFDPFRILCDQLRDRTPDAAPNMAVVHLSHVREKGSLSTKLREAEQAMGVQGLPCLILSSTAQMKLEDGVLAGRRVELLPSTITISKWIEGVHRLLGPV